MRRIDETIEYKSVRCLRQLKIDWESETVLVLLPHDSFHLTVKFVVRIPELLNLESAQRVLAGRIWQIN